MNRFDPLNEEHAKAAAQAAAERQRQEAEAARAREVQLTQEQQEREQKGYSLLTETAERQRQEQVQAPTASPSRAWTDQTLQAQERQQEITDTRAQAPHQFQAATALAHGEAAREQRTPMEVAAPEMSELEQPKAARAGLMHMENTPTGTRYTRAQGTEGRQSEARQGQGGEEEQAKDERSPGREISDRAREREAALSGNESSDKAQRLAAWMKQRSKDGGKDNEHELC